MIFRRELAEQILAGEKTATRRRMSDNPRSPWFREKCAYEFGQVFAVQPGRGKKRIGDARVTAVYSQSLYAIANFQAREEGFEDRYKFFAAWAEINGDCDTGELVHVIEFEVVGSDG